jgi:hypothetical protein
MVAACCAIPSYSAKPLTLVNTNQHAGRFPVAVHSDAAEGRKGQLALLVQGRRYPADRIGEGPEGIVALVELPTLGAAPVTVVAGPCAPVMPLIEQADRFTIRTDVGSATFSPTMGLVAIAHEKRQLALRLSDAQGHYRIIFRGSVCTVVKSATRTFIVWRNGQVRLLSSTPVTVEPPTADAHVYACKHALGYRVCQVTGPGRWIIRDESNQALHVESPREWAEFYDASRKVGLWVKNMAWEGTDVIDAAGAIRYAIPSSAQRLVLDLRPITTVEGGEDAYRRCFPVLTFAGNTAILPAWSNPAYRIEAHDENGNGLDLRADRYVCYDNDRRVSAFAFRRHHLLGYLPHGKNTALADDDLATPALLCEDWNRDGRYFDGPVWLGGYLHQDRVFRGQAGWGAGDIPRDPFYQRPWGTCVSAYDLDGDGDSDIHTQYPNFYFDLEDRLIGHSLAVNPWRGTCSSAGPSWPVQQRGTGVSWGSGGLTRSYQGYESEEGESQLSFNLDDTTRAPEAKLRMTGQNWGNWRDLVGLRWNRFCMANLDGKSDEELNGHYSWDIQFQTGREIQDYTDTGDCFRYCNRFTLTDRWGHHLKLRMWEVPPDWDGKKLTMRYLPKERTTEMHSHAPWKGIAVHWYPKLLGIFEAEGVLGEPADEGMEPWALSYALARRWEVRTTPKPHGEPITIYYSPLMGGFHFKGAEFSHVNAPASWSGTTIDWSVKSRVRDHAILPYTVANVLNGDLYADPYRLRIWGGLFLCAWDTDRDDYFDTYLYDETNDGLTDRVLSYQRHGELLSLTTADGVTAWRQTITFTDQPFLLENYPAISRLYREGNRHEPMVTALTLAQDGLPAYERQSPGIAVHLAAEWLPVAGVDAYHSGPDGYTWTDFRDGGLLRLGGELSQRRFRLTTITGPYTRESLQPLSVLVISRFDRMLTLAELAALEEWLRHGGRLLVLNATESAEERLLLNALTGRFGIRFTNRVLEKRTARWRQPHYGENTYRDMRHPAEWNRVTHFSSTPASWLTGVNYLSFTGTALAVTDDAVARLSYDGQPVIAERQVGTGRVCVSGASFFVNRYLCYPLTNDGAYTENRLLLQRLTAHLTDGIAVPRVLQLTSLAGRHTVTLSGKGGRVRFPGVRAISECTLDGKALASAGSLTVPPGAHRIELSE